MDNRTKKILGVVIAVVIIGIVIAQPVPSEGPQYLPIEFNIGPNIDHVVYNVISQEDQRVQAIQNGDADILARITDTVYLPTLQAEPDVTITQTLRNGYGHFTFNCQKYPMNISAFRRAFAYAFDKTRVTTEVMGNLSQEHDSVVPYLNSWCIEDDLPYNYYTAQVDVANRILDDAGFSLNGERYAPDDSHINITILYPSISPDIAGDVAQIAVDAFADLGIQSQATPIDFDDMKSLVNNNEDFDMVFYAYDFHEYGVEWLAGEFWGELADVPNKNPSNFRDEVYDSWRDLLLHATTHEKVYEAAEAMQLILHQNVPIVVAYQNILLQAYRTDLFTGYVEDVGRGIEGIWTLRNLHRIGGVPGGTVRIAIAEDPDSFNIFVDSNSFSSLINAELWPSLFLRGPNLERVPYLAEQFVIETHSDDPSIKEGHTRFTFDIAQNAKWNDGTDLTAEDVAFSFNYTIESGVFGNPARIKLRNLVAAYAPSTYTVVLEFNLETYWLFSTFAYSYIIPKHIFNDETGIGYAAWDSWEPNFGNASLNYGAGPFIASVHILGDFVELDANPDFWHYPEDLLTTLDSDTESDSRNKLSEFWGVPLLLTGVTSQKRRKPN